jgi:hypothetical protein
MNQVAQFALIAPISNRAFIRRVYALTKQAAHVILIVIFIAIAIAIFIVAALRRAASSVPGQVHRRATNGAVRSLQWMKGIEAMLTNGKAGSLNQGGTANTAFGRKESKE